MAATIRITCNYTTPDGLEWAGKLNSSFHPPHALIDGQEKSLKWGAPTDIQIAPGERHKLEVYFRVFDVLRMCGAEAEIPPLADGETRLYQYAVVLKDRYLNRGSLSAVQ
jgi:hypothetical protein